MTDARIVAFSYAGNGLIILAALSYQWLHGRLAGITSQPFGMDPLGKTLLEWSSAASAPFYGAGLWFAICLVVEIFLPSLDHGVGWVFGSQLQALLILDYVFLVPLLLSVYISLACSLRQLKWSPHSVGWRSRVAVAGWWLCGAVVAFIGQHQVIQIQTDPRTSTPPSLWIDAHCLLNWQGAAHAALRGLDTLLALGLAGLVFVAFLHRNTIGGDSLVESHRGHRHIRGPVRALNNHLIIASMLATLIVVIHGVTIRLHDLATTPRPSRDMKLAQFISSTWFIWLPVAVIWSGLVLAIIYAMHRRAHAELKAEENRTVQRLTDTLPPHLREDARQGHSIPSSPQDPADWEQYANYRTRLIQLHDEYDRADTWPLAPWLRIRRLSEFTFLAFVASFPNLGMTVVGGVFNPLLNTTVKADLPPRCEAIEQNTH